MSPTVPSRLPPRLRIVVALAAMTSGVLVPTAPAGAAMPVSLNLPVPCGTVLADTTYASHWPNSLSVDFNVPGAGERDRGTPIVAPADATVVELTPKEGQVELDVGSGVHVWLLHMSGIAVRPGQRVARGERIGAMDRVGHATGVHLHLHMSVGGRWVTPEFVEGRVDYRASTTMTSANGCSGSSTGSVARATPSPGPPPRVYEPLAGDFDGDGATDLALRGIEDGTFFIKLGPDHDSNQTAYRWAPGANYQAIAGDFDGRGATDIGLRNAEDGRFHLRTGPGFADQTVYSWAPGANYQAIAGDFDGDGVTDIGLRDVTDGRFFLKRGPEFAGNQTVYTWAAGAKYQAFAGDVDGDGTAEIGLRDPADGRFLLKRGPEYGAGQTTYPWSPGAHYTPFAYSGGLGLRDIADGTLYLKDGPAWSGQTSYRWARG